MHSTRHYPAASVYRDPDHSQMSDGGRTAAFRSSAESKAQPTADPRLDWESVVCLLTSVPLR